MTVDPSAVTASEGRPAAAAAKQTVGKYRLDRVIGSGGMGVVWAAFDPDLERKVAVKLLHVEGNEPTLRMRLLREARAMAKLRHPNVVTVFDVGTDVDRDYIAMELVEGGTLADWFVTKPAPPAMMDALLAAGRGLAAAHTAGLVHRDFKPHNVLRADDGHIYVTDFGLARGVITRSGAAGPRSDAELEDGPTPVPLALPVSEDLVSGSQPRRPREFLDSTLTQTGVLIGTPAYMAPEQFGGGTPGPKSDQFAFCVTAWQALAGERPFRGQSIQELEAAAKAGTSKLVANLEPTIRAVLERGLDPSPDARWPDMPSLLAALAAAAAPPQHKRARWVMPVAIGGAVASIAGGLALFVVTRNSSNHDECRPAIEAFAPAWNAERRAEVKRMPKGEDGEEGQAIVMMLDGVKTNWIRSYTATCSAPRTRERSARLQCLLEFRDELARIPNAELDTVSVAMQFMSIGNCDPTITPWRGFGPTPPTPPIPPVGPPGESDN